MTSIWIMLIPSQVFTRIKTEFSEKIKTKYSMTSENFSTTDSQNKKAVFPFVYINLLPASETGNDLAGDTINGGIFTFQIDVYDNKTQARAREVMTEVVRIMKSMRFLVNQMPSFDDTEDVKRMTTRFQRIIGSGDIL